MKFFKWLGKSRENEVEPLKYRDFAPREPEPRPLIIKRTRIVTRAEAERLIASLKPSPTTFYPPIDVLGGE